MPGRTSKRPRDLNALAKSIVDDATSDEPRPQDRERYGIFGSNIDPKIPFELDDAVGEVELP